VNVTRDVAPTLTIPGKAYAIARSMGKPAKRRTRARRSYHHGDLRRVLVATALELAEEQDVSNLTLREVARRAGVTHSAPYHHFPTKESLLAAVAEEGFRALYAEQLEAAKNAGPRPIDRLQALGVAYVRFAVAHRGHFRVMYRTDKDGWADYPSVLAVSQQSFVLLTTTAEETRAAGGLDVDLLEMSLAAWSVVHGLATLWVDGPLRRLTVLTGNRPIDEVAARITAFSTRQLA
jgi:AcrR family transcriptional regulator